MNQNTTYSHCDHILTAYGDSHDFTSKAAAGTTPELGTIEKVKASLTILFTPHKDASILQRAITCLKNISPYVRLATMFVVGLAVVIGGAILAMTAIATHPALAVVGLLVVIAGFALWYATMKRAEKDLFSAPL